jgi:hypothetical protein
MAKLKVTKESLIKDLKQVAGERTSITRHEYLQSTKLGKRYEPVFRTFDDFREAAGLEAANQQSESHVIDDDKLTITLPKTAIHTYDELVNKFSIDTKVWEVSRFNATYSNTDESAPYRVVAFLRKRKDILAIQEEVADLKRQAKQSIVRKITPTKPPSKSGLMLEIAISDHHYGKLAWPSETGGSPYDLNIASAVFSRALDTLLKRASGMTYESILLVAGNDYLHANDVQGKTANGTQLDTDCRFQKTYTTARKNLCDAVERLREIAPVKVLACYGNHDKLSMWTLADSVECYFAKDPRVTVDNEPIYRKYHQWGKCGLMFTHGDLGKRPDFPLVFATDKPEMFGSTLYREVHTGHNHTTKTEEFHGVRVRILPSLTPADAWHAENQYVNNLRSAEAFVWSKDEGLIAQYIYCDNAYPELKTKRALI